MTDFHPDAEKLITNFIENEAEEAFRPTLRRIRALIHSADAEIREDWKWGANFNRNGMVCSLWSFKAHIHFGFFRGAELSDPKNMLTEGATNRSARFIKLLKGQNIDDETVIAYVQEAVALNLKGKPPRVKNAPVPLEAPEDFLEALENSGLKERFESMSYTHRKEYILWITEAKRPETRERRLVNAMVRIAKGLASS